MVLKSNGVRPHVYDLPNEPNPLEWNSYTGKKTYQDENLYYFVPGQPTLAQSYVNSAGQDISTAITGWDTRKNFRKHNFKNVETMINALRRANVSAYKTGDAIYARWDSDIYNDKAVEKARLYQAWKDKEVYRIDWVDDPTVEGIGDPVFHKGKRTEPAGKIKRTDKIFGRKKIDDTVKLERNNINSVSLRKYRIMKYNDTVFWNVTHQNAMLLGFDGSDMRIGDRVRFKNAIDGGDMYIVRVE